MSHSSVQMKLEHRFDATRCRHTLNGITSVLHCHHYSTLYTQLAVDARQFDGVQHLVATAEEIFYEVLDAYYRDHGIADPTDRVEIAQQYYKAVGMGLITFTGVGRHEATAEMEYSHLDAGWLQKWGGHDSPINFFTVGFVAAVAALVNDRPVRSFAATETRALVCGADKSEFKAVLR